jgi:hypothetical protein
MIASLRFGCSPNCRYTVSTSIASHDLWRLAERTEERAAHALAIGETGFVGDDVEGCRLCSNMSLAASSGRRFLASFAAYNEERAYLWQRAPLVLIRKTGRSNKPAALEWVLALTGFYPFRRIRVGGRE